MKQVVLIITVLLAFWHRVNLVSVEPIYTKFKYEEQLLEKMVRLEYFVENMAKTVNTSISDSVQSLKNITGITSNDIAEMNKRLDDFAGDIVTYKKSVDTILEDIRRTNRQFRDQVELKVTHTLEKATNQMNKSMTANINEIRTNTTKALEDVKQRVKNPVIAFNAYKAVDRSPGKDNPVVFTTVLLNEGDGYDSTTGHFTATVDGVYQFNAQLCVEKGSDLEYTITVEKQDIATGEYRTASDSNDGKCTSFGAVGIVRKGQKVKVRGWTATLFENDDDWNSFSGVLIQPL